MDTKFIGIIGHQNVASGGSKYTLYYLEVSIDETSYVVKHRYHDFKELYDKVCRRHVSASQTTANTKQLTQEGYKCPQLPPKKFIGSFNPDFLVRRQQELSNWLQQLTNWDASSTSPDPKHSEALKVFLRTNVRVSFVCQCRADSF